MRSRFASRAGALALAMMVTVVTTVDAQSVVPTGSTFGTLAGATFNGSGIPNTAVMQTVVDGVTLGLTATARYGNSPLTNDGFGTFYASPGSDIPATYATWNWDWYIGGVNEAKYNYGLLYDFDPAAGTVASALGFIPLFGVLAPDPAQDSYNSGMAFLAANPLHPSGVTSFDPTAQGQYGYSVVMFDKNVGNGFSSQVGQVSILVNTTTAPEPATYALVAAGLLGIAVVRRRQLTV